MIKTAKNVRERSGRSQKRNEKLHLASAAAHRSARCADKASKIRFSVSQVATFATMIKHDENQVVTLNPIFKSESFGYYFPEQNCSMMEKRQLFLRSYQFCRKKNVAERIKGSLARARKVVWLRLRSAVRLRKWVFSRFKCGFYYRRRRFFRLFNYAYHYRRSDSRFF